MPITSRHARRTLWSVVVLLCSCVAWGQSPTIAWQHAYGGSDNDMGYALYATADGGSIVVGETWSSDGDVSLYHGNIDAWVLKLNATGGIAWQRALGGSGQDYATDVQQTSDGGFIVSAVTGSPGGDVSGFHGWVDAWLVKLDAAGQIEWQHAYGGSGLDRAAGVAQTSDGGFVFAGSAVENDGDVEGAHGGSDVWVVRVDTAGTILWKRCLGGSLEDGANGLALTPDGGVLVCGLSYSADGDVSTNAGGYDCWVLKLSAAGDLLWQDTFGGSSGDEATGITSLADGRIAVIGRTFSSDGDVTGAHGESDLWTLMLNSSGELLDQRAYGGSLGDFSGYAPMISNTDGNIMTASTYSNNADVSGNHGGGDAWLARTDSTGDLLWQGCYGGSAADGWGEVVITSDGAFLCAGFANSNNGDVSGNHGQIDVWVTKLLDPFAGIPETPMNGTITLFPNPATSAITVISATAPYRSIEVMNAAGIPVLNETMKAPTRDHSLNVEGLPNGVYVVLAFGTRTRYIGRFVKL